MAQTGTAREPARFEISGFADRVADRVFEVLVSESIHRTEELVNAGLLVSGPISLSASTDIEWTNRRSVTRNPGDAHDRIHRAIAEVAGRLFFNEGLVSGSAHRLYCRSRTCWGPARPFSAQD